MTHKELEKRIIEARINAIDELEVKLHIWAYFDKDEEKKIKKILKALEDYEDLLYERLEK